MASNRKLPISSSNPLPSSLDVVRLIARTGKAEECELAGPNTREESPDINKVRDVALTGRFSVGESSRLWCYSI
jgi:hypothetical protein